MRLPCCLRNKGHSKEKLFGGKKYLSALQIFTSYYHVSKYWGGMCQYITVPMALEYNNGTYT